MRKTVLCSVRNHCEPTWLAVDDAGAEGSANVPRPLCGLLLDLAKPQVHAAPSAPASSAITYREHAAEWVLGVFRIFICFRALAGVFISLVAI